MQAALSVFDGPNSAEPKTGGPSSLAAIATGQAVVHVATSDVENLTITLRAGGTIPGRVAIDDASSLSAVPGADHLRISLSSTAISALSAERLGTVVGEDGTFTLTGIAPGEYRFGITGLPAGAYAKSVRLGSEDVLHRVFSISDEAPGRLEISLSSKGGQIDGTIVKGDVKVGRDTQAVLIPDQRDSPDLYKTVTVDSNGGFSFQGIPPGDYKIFVWEDIEPFSYFDADVLKRFEEQAKRVHIEESAKDHVEVTIIPAHVP